LQLSLREVHGFSRKHSHRAATSFEYLENAGIEHACLFDHKPLRSRLSLRLQARPAMAAVPPVVPAVPAAAAAPPTVVAPIMTFRELCDRPEANTHAGNHAGVLQASRVPATHADWVRADKSLMALDNSVTTNAYVGLFATPGFDPGRTRLLHAPREFPAVIGRPTACDGQACASLDDFAAGTIQAVDFRADFYNITPEITIATTPAIGVAFFFLLRPGEHTTQRNNTPSRSRDARLHIGGALLHPRTASFAQLDAVTSCSLTFTTQKNAVKGEIITHGHTGDAFTCPVAALVRRVCCLISHGCSDDTPLCACQDNSEPTTTKFVNPAGVKEALRGGLIVYGADRVEIQPSEIEARSLRAGGAAARR